MGEQNTWSDDDRWDDRKVWSDNASDLEALAARVEAAGGPDRNLDALIAPLADLRVVDEGYLLGRCCYDGKGVLAVLPSYTRSLDAALTLVPEGCGWLAGLGQMRPAEPVGGAAIYRSVHDHTVIAEGEGPTVALALVAAALRTIAATASETTRG